MSDTTIIAQFSMSLNDIYFVIYGTISEFTDKGQFQYLTNLKGHQEGLTCMQHNSFTKIKINILSENT